MPLAWESSGEIFLPRLVIDGIEVIPDLSLGLNIDKITNQNGYVLSALEAQSYRPPTLAELVHAYFGKDENGDHICPQYRRSVLREKETGEWTSTFIIQGEERDNIILVNRPEEFFIDEYGQLSIEYSEKNSFEISNPPAGYIISIDSLTGWPVKTGDRDAAMNALGGDFNYFQRPNKINGISAVARFFYSLGKGTFYICTGINPTSYDGNIGVRTCRRAA